MTITCTRNCGLLLKHSRGWAQLSYGRGCSDRRLIWWPQHGQISLRIGGWWWGVGWRWFPREAATR